MIKKIWLLTVVSSAPIHAMTINSARLNDTIQQLAQFGKNRNGGVSRLAYSEVDLKGREYVLGIMKNAGLSVSIDAAGNLIGQRAGSAAGAKPILMGSHIDSVPEGGNYDGVVGSLGAIEVARTLNERGVNLNHPLEVVIFQNEEGGHLGSRAITSGLSADDLSLVSLSGKKVGEGIKFIGGNLDKLSSAKLASGDFMAYLELHIEQGGILEAEKKTIGVVDGIVGIRRWNVTVTGIANHAGTTPMKMRKDALVGAAEFITKINRLILKIPGRQVGTVGKIEVQPGAPNVIPGVARFTFEIRDLDAKKIDSLFKNAKNIAKEIEKENGAGFEFKETYNTAPVLSNPQIKSNIENAARVNGWPHMHLPSGAGHDAQEFARLGPVGILFIPSIKGISHSPEEYSTPEDIGKGAQVLYDALIAVDRSH